MARPLGEFKTTSDYQYQLLKCNCNLLKLIQLGITFYDKTGSKAPGLSTFQFNFKFNLGYVTCVLVVFVCAFKRVVTNMVTFWGNAVLSPIHAPPPPMQCSHTIICCMPHPLRWVPHLPHCCSPCTCTLHNATVQHYTAHTMHTTHSSHNAHYTHIQTLCTYVTCMHSTQYYSHMLTVHTHHPLHTLYSSAITILTTHTPYTTLFTAHSIHTVPQDDAMFQIKTPPTWVYF